MMWNASTSSVINKIKYILYTIYQYKNTKDILGAFRKES